MTCRLERDGETVRVDGRRPRRRAVAGRRREGLPALLHDQEVRRHGPRASRSRATSCAATAARSRSSARDGGGTEARVDLPRVPGGIAFMRVLVVDDEEVIRDVLGTLLTREGYEVTAAATAGEAVALFEAEPHDVVLLDLMLPDRPGPRRAARDPAARPRRRRRDRDGVLLDRGRHRGDARRARSTTSPSPSRTRKSS